MSVHLNLRNGKIRTDDEEDIVQTAAPAAQETAAQTSADYERQVRLNLKKGTVSYGGKSYGLSHEGTSNAGSQALQERIDARSREQRRARAISGRHRARRRTGKARKPGRKKPPGRR